MEELWPTPSVGAAETIRSVAQQMLAESDGFAEEVISPAFVAQKDAALLADGSLTNEDHQISRSDLVQWLTANIQHPGRRVQLYFSSRTTTYLRDLASRGIAPDFVDAWRVALAIAWRRWLQACLGQSTDPAVLEEVLDVSAQSMVQYALDWMAAAREARVSEGMPDADSEAIAMIQLISSGAPVAPEVAETRLSYRLTRWHRALVLWVADPEHADALEDAVRDVRATPAGRTALVARASTTSRWIWLSGTTAPDAQPFEKALARTDEVQVALGRSGHGLDGFRSSHQDALAAQAMVIRLGSVRRFTAYADVELIDTLTRDRDSARRFVFNTLGPLIGADRELREALLTYVQCGFNTTRAAAALYAHRNTVERRVSRANELATVKVEDNPAHVAAALLVLDVAPDLATGSTLP